MTDRKKPRSRRVEHRVLSLSQRMTRAYDAMLQSECEVAAQIMAQDPTVTRGQALREAAIIVKRRG